MPRILKKDLEARIVELERQVAIATEFLTETVRYARDWRPADAALRKMGRVPVFTDPNCPPDVLWSVPRGSQRGRPELYL